VNPRYRPISFALGAIILVWLVAWGGYVLARGSKVTAESVRAFIEQNDLSKLSGDARKKALRKLAEKINALTPEERRKARVEQLSSRWFAQMTDAEKGDFIDATMPGGFKQMLNAFEQLPPERRQRAVQESVRRLRETREQLAVENPKTISSTNSSTLSDDLQNRVATIGLKSFYSESSAQTKAELAPLLEEIQRSMENGSLFRGRPGPPPQ
jgi:gamma-glutamyl phosphate reductase